MSGAGGGGGAIGEESGGGGGGGSGFVKAGATGITQTTGNSTASGNGEVDITAVGGSGSCVTVVPAAAFTG
jgi:hypothetical protein